MPFPGPSSSGVWRAQSLRLIAFPVSAAQISGCIAGVPSQEDDDCPEPQKSLLAKKPACILVGNVSLGLRLSPSSPYGSGCLSLEGDGLQPAISVPSFILCTVLAVSYVRAFRVVAIPQSGLLAQVSSLWPRVGRSGPILKKALQPTPPAAQFLKSTAACASCSSLPSPHLLVADTGVCAAFPLGELLLGS